jgi:hypothetical protein
MRPVIRKKKILGFLALALFALLLAPFVAVQIQERIFRHRAEQLLADMRFLMLHRANLNEARPVFNRWNVDGDPCAGQDCSFEVELQGGPSHSFDMYPTEWDVKWTHLLRKFGSRYAVVRAQAHLDKGIVSYVTVSVHLEDPSGDVLLSGEVTAIPRFSAHDIWQGLALHPNYLIGKADNGRIWGTWRDAYVYANFDPHASAEDITRLASFDLSCLTRLRACREPGDLLPGAAAQSAKEEPQLAQARREHFCSAEIVGLLARNADYAGVVEVKAIADFFHTATVRMIQNFVLVSDWKTGENFDLMIFDATTNFLPSLPPEVSVGNRFILLSQTDERRGEARAELCGIVPLTPANLELVQRAIAGNHPTAKP